MRVVEVMAREGAGVVYGPAGVAGAAAKSK